MKRRRSQAGQRVTPGPVRGSGLQISTSCPICGRRSWLHRIFDRVPDGCGSYVEPEEPWAPLPLEVNVMRRWPRRPGGGKGFFWERLPVECAERVSPGLVPRVERRFAQRMLRWLATCGIDAADVQLSE